MPELTVLHCITREGYLYDADRRTMTHSTHHTEFCTRMIQRLRGDLSTAGMFFETESTVLGTHLRMDGLIRLRLYRPTSTPDPATEDLPPWHVPWMPTLRTARVPGTLDVTFAVEIDEGKESLPILERKALNYRRTFTGAALDAGAGGHHLLDAANESDRRPVHWQKVLCPPDVGAHITAQVAYFPIPVVVMNSETRLAHVWQAWNRGWPGSEVRMTTWEHLGRARSVMSAAYLNQDRQWVDLLGSPQTAR
jgi:hypothetical protein